MPTATNHVYSLFWIFAAQLIAFGLFQWISQLREQSLQQRRLKTSKPKSGKVAGKSRAMDGKT
jgi:hypothetical protein